MSLFINQPEEEVVPRRVTVASSFNGKAILALLVVLIDPWDFMAFFLQPVSAD